MEPVINFTIIIITHNREAFLKKLLEQIREQEEHVKIIIVHNSHREFQETSLNTPNDHNIKIIQQKFPTPAAARNNALSHCESDWVLFLDDDIEIPENYFQKSKELLNSYKLEERPHIFGGPDRTPLKAKFFEEAVGLALTSPMTTASTRYRHSPSENINNKASEKDLILCHLWIDRQFLERHKLSFPSLYFRNEENLLIDRASYLGARITYSPELFVYHHRKSHLKSLFMAVFRSGLYRVKSFSEFFDLKGILFLVPAGWVLFLSSFLLGLLPSHSIAILYTYLILSILATSFAVKKKPLYFPVALLYQFYINIVYGLGVLAGFIRLIVSRFI